MLEIYRLCNQAKTQWLHVFPVTSLIKSTRRSLWTVCRLKQKNVIDLHDKDTASRLETIKHLFDVRDPGQFFMQARSMKRHFIIHVGPTNSGKTYHAMEAFLHAENAIYCGPLRMLAGEIYRKSNVQNVPCDMITGEEKLWAVSSEEPSNHIACTVELCSTVKNYDVAIIDEVQMLEDTSRGWAWTRALLGVPAKEIHLCAESSAINIVKKLLSKTADTLEVKKYERITPLKILNKSVSNLKDLKTGDCVISFSQKDIYSLRADIEKRTGLKCAVIYGTLPSNIRSQQAEKYNNGECDILVASDAIGMGMNLNINRIVFSQLEKFDGGMVQELTPRHVKQIAGRAGRYKSKYETGFVTSLDHKALPLLKKLYKMPIKDIRKAGIRPSFEQLELLSFALPGKGLLQLLEIFEMLIELDNNYFLCDVEDMKMVCREIEEFPLTLQETFFFAVAPVNLKNKKTRNFFCYLLKKFAQHVCDKSPVTDVILKGFVKWPPNAYPRTLAELQHLERIHVVFDLYRWLSYHHLEDIFVDIESIINLQERLEEIIGHAVSNVNDDEL